MQVPEENKTTLRLTKKRAQVPTHSTPSMQSEHKDTEVEKINVSKKTVCQETHKLSDFSFLPTGTPVSYKLQFCM